MDSTDKIKLYRSLFRGRDDIFARHWDKTGGYFPDYTFDWNEFNAHKAHGGTIKDFEHKTPTPLTDSIVRKHLTGQMTIGVYPILEDNTSYFIAADFDGKNWLNDCLTYSQELDKVGLTAYIERSRSGNGGHVWVFFEDAYPCHKSRAIGLEVARKALDLSAFDKEASFDRLFPSQDTITKNGLGNLIALPFQGESVKNENTVFIDPITTEPYEDQFTVLQSIKRQSIDELETAYNKLVSGVDGNVTKNRKRLKISVGQNITLQKAQLSGPLVGYLKEQLNFLSTEYLTRKRLGKSLYKVQKYFRLIDESAKTVTLPRGFLSRLLNFCYENNIEYEVSFVTPRLPDCKFKSNIKLKEAQRDIVELAQAEKQGIIVAPPSSGKTMIGLELIAKHQKPALVLVHRQQLLDQWVDRTQKFLNIPKIQIGRFSGSKKSIGKEITVGLLQSFARSHDLVKYRDKFGTIIVDECHHIPAKTFREVIANLNPEFLYGLTATPKRKHNDEQLIYVYIGDIIADMSDYITAGHKQSVHFETVIRETALAVPFNWKTDQFNLIANVVSYDTSRNAIVVGDILEQVKLGRKTLVLSERKEHLKILELYLNGQCETLMFTGDDSATSRVSKMKQISDGHYQVLLATGQIFGEGMHIDNIEALVLAFPFAFEGKLTQYVGRLMHSSSPKVLIDYHDKNIAFLDRQFKQRERVYKKLVN